jgi:hypothetical protein
VFHLPHQTEGKQIIAAPCGVPKLLLQRHLTALRVRADGRAAGNARGRPEEMAYPVGSSFTILGVQLHITIILPDSYHWPQMTYDLVLNVSGQLHLC